MQPTTRTVLERLEAKAQRAHDETGEQHCVLNFNTAGTPLYVCRRYEGPEAYATESPRFVVFVSQDGGGF